MSSAPLAPFNNRILVIDDNPAIHEDFRKVLSPTDSGRLCAIEEDEAALFGSARSPSRQIVFELESAFQGVEGLEKVRAAAAAGRPFAMAFVDGRMPPGWDGIETILHIWKEFPELQMVLCTAYSDYSWDQIAEAVGSTDSILILKKPFDSVEALQIAHALTRKWQLAQAARQQMAELDALVSERTIELREANEQLRSEMRERATTEAALRRSEERFSKAFQTSPLAMCIQHFTTGALIDVNSSYETLAGYSRAELLGPDALPVEIWADPQTPASIRAGLAQNRTVRGFTSAFHTRDGELRDALVSAEQFVLGSEPHLLLIFQDITERVRLEAQLRQAQKMEAVGQLAAGIAHDFNNLLTVILGNTSMQLHNAQLDEKVARSLRQVVRASERATVLTRQLLAYSRKQIIQRRAMNLNETIEHGVAMLRRVIGEHIAIETVLSADLPSIHADPTSVDQIIMNLTLNARDAMRNGGKLTVRSELCEIGDAHLALYPEAQTGRFVCLTVADSGAGMAPGTLARIFEPFFTTKEPGQGTGMGLATVYGIIKQHEGWTEVESEPQCGTTFRVYFSISQTGAAVETLTDRQPLIPSSPGRTILVAEDEEMLREYVKCVLESLGYRVLVAANGVEALRIWEEEKGRVDLLLTDVVMPESISGWQLAGRLTAQNPALKVIFTSGYSAELITPEFEERVEYAFLAKPFLSEKLARIIATSLGDLSPAPPPCQVAPPAPALVSAA